MKINIQIDCDNAAFNPSELGCDGTEVARILGDFARRIEPQYLAIGDRLSGMDFNGNKVAILTVSK